MQEFPDMSIGEFHAVENERGLIIKFKTGAFPVKVLSGFTRGKMRSKQIAEARPPVPFSPGVLWRAKKLINAILTNSKCEGEPIWSNL
ncbi:hypothetical protein CFBP6624_00975 [Agrobacterium tumefaciens]|uniref:Uncharacterized protein n=1 Tax=Agrobacterium tumefaciens TaxID=358 RepID=A0AAE6EIM9_AGRTU|nr:hypothetical protein CFBP6624_00975 [Agrobacterium tumefaciens]